MKQKPTVFKRRKPVLVCVDWHDSTGYSGWCRDKEWEMRDPDSCQSVGWIISENKDGIHLAATRTTDRTAYNDRMVIPRGCIKTVRHLEERKK